MSLTFKKIFFIFVLSISFFVIDSFAQNQENILVLSKKSNLIKQKKVSSNSYFKVKTLDGVKSKGKFSKISTDYFITTANDTIYRDNIKWIKAKTQLGKLEKGLAIAGVFGGIYFSFGTIPAGLILPLIYAEYWAVLLPIVTVSASIYGIRKLAGRRYKMKKWQLASQEFN